MLDSAAVIAFVATSDVPRAKTFYADALGLDLVRDDGFALVFDAHGTMLRVTQVQEVTVAPYTVLGWDVADVGAAMAALGARGVQFERYDGVEQDEQGIWTAPSGDLVAWFKDPDGNTLSISHHS
jgi:catechol 2,3-dioxygenase-like lactoylglutathione lyase family enzyme